MLPATANISKQVHKGAHILIIEDDKEVRQDIAYVLTKKGFHVTQCDNGEEGLNIALHKKFNLVLLDKMLPKMNGLDLLNKLREHNSTPVIILSASGAEADRIEGLSIGADDYLPKPFNIAELLLRINAILKRCESCCDSAIKNKILNFNDLTVNLSDKTAYLQNKSLNLTPIELELLFTFIEQRHDTLSKAYLYQKVLRKAFSRYDRSLDMHISNLRSKLCLIDVQHRYIRTIYGKGYSL